MNAGRRGHGAYVLVIIFVVIAGAMASFIFGRAYRGLALQKAPFGRLAYVPSFDPIEDVTLGVPMDSGNITAALPTASIRAIQVFPTQVLMLAGGRATRIINLTSPVTSLHALVGVIHDPGLLQEQGSRITLNAAVISGGGNAMSVVAPVTTHVVMTTRPGVFLAANQGTLRLSGVDVRASDTSTPTAGSRKAQRSDLGRPFILANDHSTMTVENSQFRHLGRDWNSSYGLAWSKGSTGSVNRSLFEHNFIGIYTDHSVGLKIQNSEFYRNSLYGIDPHSSSSKLLVEHNISNYNGRHGIIFSDHVVDGVVRNNVTIGNGLNGIMMDEFSTRNVIQDNTVEGNKSDGIVMADSGHNTISGNHVSGNRVGIHVRGPSSTNVHAFDNIVVDNDKAGQGLSLGGNAVHGNGGEWSLGRIGWVWATSALVLLVLLLFTWSSRRSGGSPRGPVPSLG